ncbi:hypothetical protein LINPERPRIM_LOCUS21256 [Linum perenne]
MLFILQEQVTVKSSTQSLDSCVARSKISTAGQVIPKPTSVENAHQVQPVSVELNAVKVQPMSVEFNAEKDEEQMPDNATIASMKMYSKKRKNVLLDPTEEL